MPGERNLRGDREDPVAVVGAVRGRGLHERGLRQPGLAREREHRLVVDAVGVVHDRELVARQRRSVKTSRTVYG